MTDSETFSLSGASHIEGFYVEIHPDGSVVLVVEGERLFRFDSIDALLEQYQLSQGDSVNALSKELLAAEAAAHLAIEAIGARPRAEKALIEPPVAVALERVRRARGRLRALAPEE